MPQAYDSLAEWFEYLNDDCDYPRWSQYFIDGLSIETAGRKGLEIGCGSGAFCRALAKKGYCMTGADISSSMIARAQVLARENGCSITFVLADATKFRSPEKYDFILSPNDCFNYIPKEKLKTAFRRMADCLKDGGIFWFDVSSEYKLRNKVANNMSIDDRDEVTYLSVNDCLGDRVEMNVTLFIKEGELYRRADETHVQYIYSEEELLAALSECGFEVLHVEGHLGEPKEGSDRLNFICKKRRGKVGNV